MFCTHPISQTESEAMGIDSQNFPLFNAVMRSPAVLSIEFVVYYLENHPVNHITLGCFGTFQFKKQNPKKPPPLHVASITFTSDIIFLMYVSEHAIIKVIMRNKLCGHGNSINSS